MCLFLFNYPFRLSLYCTVCAMDYLHTLARATSSALQSAQTSFRKELFATPTTTASTTSQPPPQPLPQQPPSSPQQPPPLTSQQIQHIRKNLLAPRRPYSASPHRATSTMSSMASMASTSSNTLANGANGRVRHALQTQQAQQAQRANTPT